MGHHSLHGALKPIVIALLFASCLVPPATGTPTKTPGKAIEVGVNNSLVVRGGEGDGGIGLLGSRRCDQKAVES